MPFWPLLENLFPSDRPALGLHPAEIALRWRTVDGRFDVDRAKVDVEAFIERAQRHRDVIWAIGETGFDCAAQFLNGWKNKQELLEAQDFAFCHCVRVAVHLNLPIVVHSRSAWKKSREALDGALALGLKGFMIHCYGGPAADLRWVERCNGFASFGGVATWSDARRVRQAIVECPESVLLFETDSPDLPPVLGNGQWPVINEPQYLLDVIECASELRQQEVSHLAAVNLKNFMRFLCL